MRPLYLEGCSGGCRVVLDDPALRIVVAGKADQLFPLPRISRVVCKGMVEWSMSALLACADAGINLLFLEANGEVRARWLGPGGERQFLAQRLLDLLTRADGIELYGNWYLSMEKLAVRSFARRIGMADWREVTVMELRGLLLLNLSADDKQAANLLESFLHSELLIWLADAGFTHHESLLGESLNLAADFSRLLAWDFYVLLLMRGGDGVLTMPELAEMFELRSERLYTLFRSTLSKLQQFLLAIS
ncbi:CRISPR-associated endonuclease Cas1 [Methylomonas paludis]|uniref:CRISPR-associated endonuclease Cas1 n=1 Tax=Methylomonas paludis TaxID=1173101 RepID=A0A975MPF4_9GAMM|nr:CRISPR-associated endonuclease Cas1 [Methylomonas paludis]QWF71547.1 CRISPR-associated endonuclease Cas1 [Methylomonas paludis]